jgi:hypothetical protein
MPVSETTEEKKDDGERTTVVTGCVIRDNYQGDDYYAKVTVRRRRPIRQTIQRDGRVELADIFVQRTSDNPLKKHHHFVMTSLDGKGLYMLRDKNGNEELRRECSIWDLGNVFGNLVTKILQQPWAEDRPKSISKGERGRP